MNGYAAGPKPRRTRSSPAGRVQLWPPRSSDRLTQEQRGHTGDDGGAGPEMYPRKKEISGERKIFCMYPGKLIPFTNGISGHGKGPRWIGGEAMAVRTAVMAAVMAFALTGCGAAAAGTGAVSHVNATSSTSVATSAASSSQGRSGAGASGSVAAKVNLDLHEMTALVSEIH